MGISNLSSYWCLFCIWSDKCDLEKKSNNKTIKYKKNVNNYSYSKMNGELIDSDEYVLEASRYIHLNPVRANMVEKPQNYKRSSYLLRIKAKQYNA